MIRWFWTKYQNNLFFFPNTFDVVTFLQDSYCWVINYCLCHFRLKKKNWIKKISSKRDFWFCKNKMPGINQDRYFKMTLTIKLNKFQLPLHEYFKSSFVGICSVVLKMDSVESFEYMWLISHFKVCIYWWFFKVILERISKRNTHFIYKTSRFCFLCTPFSSFSTSLCQRIFTFVWYKNISFVWYKCLWNSSKEDFF